MNGEDMDSRTYTWLTGGETYAMFSPGLLQQAAATASAWYLGEDDPLLSSDAPQHQTTHQPPLGISWLVIDSAKGLIPRGTGCSWMLLVVVH